MIRMIFKSQVKGYPVYQGDFKCCHCGTNCTVETNDKNYVPECSVCKQKMKEIKL